MSDEPNIPTELYKAVERAMDERSAWIARPDRESTEAVCRAAMNYMAAMSLRQQKHMILDGANAALETLNKAHKAKGR